MKILPSLFNCCHNLCIHHGYFTNILSFCLVFLWIVLFAVFCSSIIFRSCLELFNDVDHNCLAFCCAFAAQLSFHFIFIAFADILKIKIKLSLSLFLQLSQCVKIPCVHSLLFNFVNIYLFYVCVIRNPRNVTY